MKFKEIETDRLILRKLTPDTYKYIFDHYTEAQLIDFLGTIDKGRLDKEKEKYSKGLSTHDKSFVVFQLLDINTRIIIGSCGFHTWYTDHFRAEIGYALIDNSSKAKGLMSEAMRVVIDYGFTKMNLNRIEAFIGPDNTPSLKLIRKFGFTMEGRLRSHYYKNNAIEDSIVFSLLKNEYVPFLSKES